MFFISSEHCGEKIVLGSVSCTCLVCWHLTLSYFLAMFTWFCFWHLGIRSHMEVKDDTLKERKRIYFLYGVILLLFIVSECAIRQHNVNLFLLIHLSESCFSRVNWSLGLPLGAVLLSEFSLNESAKWKGGSALFWGLTVEVIFKEINSHRTTRLGLRSYDICVWNVKMSKPESW